MDNKEKNSFGLALPANSQNNIEYYKNIAESRNGKCLSSTYINCKTKLGYECENGHQFYAIPLNTKKGHWCQRCSAIEKAKIKKDSIEIFKQIAYEKGGKCLSENYSNQNRLLFECKEGHQWYAMAGKVKTGDWCRKCSYKRISQKNRLTIDILRKTAIDRGGLLISTEYENISTKMVWECKEKHQWETTVQNIRAGNWCKICKKIENK